MEGTVAAVIATYRPSSSLIDQARVVRAMVNRLVIVDDASPCTSDRTLRDVVAHGNVEVWRFPDNKGIARSLNIGLAKANDIQASWLLTLDQDSVLARHYVETLISDATRAAHAGIRVGAIGPRVIHDRAGVISYPEVLSHGWPSTAEIFQSGALWSVRALNEIGGFDESFAMDAVDAAACVALRESDYSILLSPDCTFQHSWGDGRRLKVFGRSVAVTEHSPARRATIVRNRLRLAPRELRQSPLQAFRSLRRVAVGTVLAVTVEQNRKEKLKSTLRALVPGTRSRSKQ